MDIYKNESSPAGSSCSSRPLVAWRVAYWRRRVAVEGVGMRLSACYKLLAVYVLVWLLLPPRDCYSMYTLACPH
mgnify:CR=1 FL=1